MATQFSDIWIDGITTEELYADGGQIMEAWLDGECIWKLAGNIQYWREIAVWTRYDNIYYGFGFCATKENPGTANWKSVYFKGTDTENMKFYSASGNYVPIRVISTGNIISAHDWGICFFGGPPRFETAFLNVQAIKGFEATEFPSRSVYVSEVIGNKFETVSDPLGIQSNVFNNAYQICGTFEVNGAYTGSHVWIRKFKDNIYYADTVIDFRGNGDSDGYRIISSAFYDNKIFFASETGAHPFSKSIFIPLFYMEESDLTEIKYIELDITEYTKPILSSTGAPVVNNYLTKVVCSNINANNFRVIFALTVEFSSRLDMSNTTQKTILYEYKNGNISNSEIPNAPENCRYGVKLVGEYIVMVSAQSPYDTSMRKFTFLAGKSISRMQEFEIVESFDGAVTYSLMQPRVFYEEKGELYCDCICTPPGVFVGDHRFGEGNSKVIKKRIDCDVGKIETVSETEINGVWED